MMGWIWHIAPWVVVATPIVLLWVMVKELGLSMRWWNKGLNTDRWKRHIAIMRESRVRKRQIKALQRRVRRLEKTLIDMKRFDRVKP